MEFFQKVTYKSLIDFKTSEKKKKPFMEVENITEKVFFT